eukprot:1527990-Ditylum_brightwellii.AAC.1
MQSVGGRLTPSIWSRKEARFSVARLRCRHGPSRALLHCASALARQNYAKSTQRPARYWIQRA